MRWLRLKDPKFLLPEKVLSRRTRNLFRTALAARPELLAQVPPVVWKKEWIVHTQAVGSGERALGYLANYVQRTALSSQRILREENGRVTFKYRQSDTGSWKLLTLETPEFLRRFLQHVLPSGFHRADRVRRSLLRGGWWSPAAKTKWERILALLDWKVEERPPQRPAWIKTCRGCGKPMERLGLLPRGPPT